MPTGTVEAAENTTLAVVPVVLLGVTTPVMPGCVLCTASAIEPAKPPVRVIVTALVAVAADEMVTAVGDAAMLKSGGGTTVSVYVVVCAPTPVAAARTVIG